MGKEQQASHLPGWGYVWYFMAWTVFMFCLCSDMTTSGLAFVLIYPGHRVTLSDVDVL